MMFTENKSEGYDTSTARTDGAPVVGDGVNYAVAKANEGVAIALARAVFTRENTFACSF